jgi:hypothetical protein
MEWDNMGNTSVIPPPPPGFTPVDSGSSSIPPPPAGFTPIPPPPAGFTTVDPQQQPGMMSNLMSSLHELGQQFTQAEQGADKSFAQVPATVGKAIQNIPGIGSFLSRHTDLDATTAQYAAKAAQPITPTDSGDTTAGTTGAALETMAEWMIGEGELRTLTQGERMVKIGQNMKLLEKFPRLAEAIGMHPDIAATLGTAARQGTVQGAQTLAHGGTASDAVTSAGTAAVLGGALEGGLRGLGSAAEGAAPGVTPIEGADFPTRPDATLNLRPLAGGAPDAATGAVDEALSNMGQRAVARSLNRNLAARTAMQEATPAAITDASRMLPPPADSTPGFTVGPAAEPTPVREGQMVYDPGKQQIGTRTVEGKGPGTFDLPSYSPELADAANEEAAQAGTLGATVPPEPVGSHREPIFQYRNQVRPGTMNPVSETASGPGQLILTDDGQQMSIARARAQQGQYESIMSDLAIWSELGTRQQQAIQNAHADISGQLRSFDDYAASQPHFDAPNVADAVANTGSLADASNQLKAENGTFWTRANELSGGRFDELRNQEKALQNALRSEGRTGDRATLAQQLQDNQTEQENLFDQHRTQLSPQEWDMHRAGYQDGMVLGNYDSLIQSHFNGITRADVADSGGKLQRVFDPGSGFNQQIENFLNKGTNRAVLERTIGREGILNTKQIGQLFDSSDRQAATKGLLDNIGSAIRRHHYGIGGTLGSGLAYGATHSLGAAAGVLGGAAAAGTVTGTISHVAQRIASDPAFARSFIYAVRNGVAPRIAGPLLAAAFMRGTPPPQPAPPQ